MKILPDNFKGCAVFVILLVSIMVGPHVIGLFVHNLSSIWLMRNYLSLPDARSFEKAFKMGQLSMELGQVSRAEVNYGRLLLTSGSWDGFVEGNDQFLRSVGDDPFFVLELGRKLWRGGDLEAAVELWRKIPDLDVFFATQGLFLESSGDAEGALSNYLISWIISEEVNPHKVEPYLHFAELLRKKGESALAIDVCQGMLEAGYNAVWANRILGMIYYNDLHDFVSAESYFRNAQHLGPEVDRADFWLGLAIFRQGRLDEAIQIYKRGVDLHPDDGLLHFELGRALLKEGETAEARYYLEKSIELCSNVDSWDSVYVGEARRLLEHGTAD